ncbi:MAG: dihydrofolate reductase [Myxococcota bacterium]|nr:dihydrofolate reductase [Myxococcota bacterium]
MIISMIAAIGLEGELGRGNELIWRIPADLKRFKQITSGHHILLGRKTFESIGGPLPDRTSIVMTRTPADELRSQLNLSGCIVVGSAEEAITAAHRAGERELIVCGGAEIYRIFLPLTTRLYLTRVQARAEADVYFPPLDPSQWRVTDEERYPAHESSPAWTLEYLSREGSALNKRGHLSKERADDRAALDATFNGLSAVSKRSEE